MNNPDIVFSIIFSTLLILLLIAGIAISLFIASRQRSRQQIDLAQAKLSYERELRQVEAEVSEQLMQQFAQELHDNIGHILTCMRLEVENRKLDAPEFEHVLSPIEVYLSEASDQLRLLSRSLNTEYVANAGLLHAIQLEVERQRHLRKFQIHWDHDYTQHLLDKNQELMTFRIFQEIIHNAIRHSTAKNVYISLHDTPDFKLHIRDDGKGFPIDDILQTPKASGLKNMLKRAAMANLVCIIDSQPGAGCTYTLQKKTT